MYTSSRAPIAFKNIVVNEFPNKFGELVTNDRGSHVSTHRSFIDNGKQLKSMKFAAPV
jgi:hypothetical protein